MDLDFKLVDSEYDCDVIIAYVGFNYNGIDYVATLTASVDPGFFDEEWEPDGCATYVPYGNGEVEYDDGHGYCESSSYTGGGFDLDKICTDDSEEDVPDDVFGDDLKELSDDLSSFALACLQESMEERNTESANGN